MTAKIQPSFSTSRQTLGHILPLNTPFTLIIDPGDVCNFRCNYCFRGSDIPSGRYGQRRIMQWQTFAAVAKQIGDFPSAPKGISLSHQGEPLCVKHLPDMLAHIKELGIASKISIHTNASLLTKPKADALAQYGLGRMIVSVQGMNSEDYRKTCGCQLDFDKFVEQLAYFHQIKRNTQICVKIVESALSTSKEDFYARFGPIADRVFVEQAVPIWGVLPEQMDIINKYGDHFPKTNYCPLVFHTLVVDSSGEILPCTQLAPPFTLGNVSTTTLHEAWQSPRRHEFLLAMLNKGLQGLEPCRHCYIPQNSVYSNGDLIDDYIEEILQRLNGKQ